MTLTLRAVSLNDAPLTQPITAHFDLHGGTIGRADHNTMALPDPERHISRQQAEIRAARSGYIIRNVGGANPIIVRNQALAQGDSAPLAHADRVRIGGYLLEVIDEETGAESAMTVTRGRAAVDAGRLPDDFDPFAMPSSSRQSQLDSRFDSRWDAQSQSQLQSQSKSQSDPRSIPDTRAPGAFDDLIPGVASGSLDDLFKLSPDTGRDPLADFMGGTLPQDIDALPTDPLSMFGTPAERGVPTLPPETLPDDVPQLRAAFAPPKAVLPDAMPPKAVLPDAMPPKAVSKDAPPPKVKERPTAPPQRSDRVIHPNADNASLWAAFCEGAGVNFTPPQGLDADTMHTLGRLLASAIEGTLALMAVRSATRHELHAQVTVIRTRDNNPLKFSPDAQSAVEQLLNPPLRGFMPGPAAVTDAMNDLVGHAIGSMAGTRAALEGVLGRFAPKDLEARLAARSMLDSVLPMNRKAKLWELYLQHHEAIRDEAQDDFHALFGKAFLAAYEQQIERLRRAGKPAVA